MINSSSPVSYVPRRFLVFVVPQFGTASPFLKLPPDRNFDLAVRFYDSPQCNETLVQSAEFVMTGGLSKFHAASLFLEQTQVHNSYEGALFLDGDLEFDVEKLSGFLSLVAAIEMDLAQPSVSRDSYCYWKMAYHQSGFLFRETSFVEVMAPYLSRSALLKVLPTFTRSISTYGLDLVWPSIIESHRIGVVDSFQIRHPDKVDHSSGKFYTYLKSIGVDLDEEERLIVETYNVVPETAHSRRGYFWKRQWPLRREDPCLVSVKLRSPELSTESQLLIDLSMAWSRWGQACREEALTRRLVPVLEARRATMRGA